MASELKLVWSQTRVYGLATALNRGAGLLLVPVYAHLLSPEEFGLYALVVMVTDLFGVLLGMELANAMVRSYFDHDTPEGRGRVVSTAIWASAALIVGIALAADPVATVTGHLLFASQEHHGLLRVALLGMIFNILFSIDLNYIRIQKRPWLYLWVSLAKSVLLLSLNILFVVGMRAGVMGIVWGTLISIGVVSVATTAGILRWVGVAFVRTDLAAMVRFGLPLMPATLSDVAASAADKYFLNKLVAIAMVGQYALANRLASLLQMFVTAPFAQIWVVRRLEGLATGVDNAEFRDIFSYFVMVLTLGGVTLSLFAPEILMVLASADYQGAVAVVPLLSLAVVLTAVNMHLQISIFHAKKTHVVLVVSLACLVANVPLNYFLIRAFGWLGAGLALAATGLLRVALTGAFSRWVCRQRVEFEWRRVAAILIAAAFVYGVGRVWAGTTVTVGHAVMKAVCLVVFVALMWLTPITSDAERARLHQSLRRLRRRDPKEAEEDACGY